MFTVKICGITCVEDARAVAAAGADAIGLNFYGPSPRYITPAAARAIVDALPPGIVKVGLFVDADLATICRTVDDLGLDLVQLHGREPPELLAQLGPRPVMKAFRPSGSLDPIVAYLDQCKHQGVMPRLVLLDALAAGAPGGTGTLADWSVARRYQVEITRPTMVLAGGLTPENVARAIRETGATAVDVASGVESSPGRKDAAAVAALVRAARAALKGDLERARRPSPRPPGEGGREAGG